MARSIKMAGGGAAGFYDFKVDRAANYPKHFLTTPGHPDDPVFVARRRMDAPYPDVEFVIPIAPATVAAYLQGDPSVTSVLATELVTLYGRFLREQGIARG